MAAHARYLKGLSGGPGIDLNTKHRETPEQREYRLLQTVTPPDTETLENFLEELYNPMLDAKCFNDIYTVPSPNKHELYRDFKKIFDWGLENPAESPLFAASTGVSANRFPGMCLRMAFHDNSLNIVNGVAMDGAEYVDSKINSVGEWNGPDLMMETSGGDASVLTCKPERFHPNQNYDQTASRILHAFQSTASYPVGPGVGADGDSLMSKYQMSYADALHNCALAALKYMTEADDGTPTELGIDTAQRDAITNVYHQFSFGRKDACYVTTNFDLLFSSDGLGANSRRPLCGPTDILPGVTLSANGVRDWFESRGMPVGVWLSLFGTHTALDNFSDPTIVRSFGLPDKDYFEDFVGCPFHRVRPPVTDPEDTGCEWRPVCKSPFPNEEPWFLVQSDCAMGIDVIQDANDPALDLMEAQMQIYIDTPGAWIPDVICALSHLGGNDSDCVGPNGITSPTVSKFGSFWRNDYPAPRVVVCDQYSCPANSAVAPGVLCLVSFNDCACNSGYKIDPATGNSCIQACDYSCPANSYPGSSCVQSFGNCVCDAGYIIEGETCIQDPNVKYADCTSRGYSLEYCQDKYGRRHLKEIDTRFMVETHDDCMPEDYDMHLVIHGVHFAGLATPVGNDACPSIVFHADSSSGEGTLEKVALEATNEVVAEIEEGDKLHLGVKPLSEIVHAFGNAPVGKEGILYDAISNNCVSMLRNMADPLEIPVDQRMIGFISRKLMDGRSDHMFEMMKNSPSLQKMFDGGRRVLAHLSDEDLLSKVIALYV